MSKKAWIILIAVILGVYYYYSSRPKWSYMMCETVMGDGSCDEPALIMIDACTSKEECIKYATKYLKYYPSFEVGRNCKKKQTILGMICEELCDRYGNCHK